MADPVYTTIPIPGTALRERVIVNDDGTLSRPTQAVFADSSGLNAEASQLLIKAELIAMKTVLDNILVAIGLLPQAS
jgi:hypothetical protein